MFYQIGKLFVLFGHRQLESHVYIAFLNNVTRSCLVCGMPLHQTDVSGHIIR